MIEQLPVSDIGSYTSSNLQLEVRPTIPSRVILPGFEELGEINPALQVLRIPFLTPIIEYADGVLAADVARSPEMRRLVRVAGYINDTYLSNLSDDDQHLRINTAVPSEVRQRLGFLRALSGYQSSSDRPAFPNVNELMSALETFEKGRADIIEGLRRERVVTNVFEVTPEQLLDDGEPDRLHVTSGILIVAAVSDFGFLGASSGDEIRTNQGKNMELTIICSDYGENTHDRMRYDDENADEMPFSAVDSVYVPELSADDAVKVALGSAVSHEVFPNLRDVAMAIVRTHMGNDR